MLDMSARTSVLIISKDAKRLIEDISKYLHSFAHFSLYFHRREQRYHNDDCVSMIDQTQCSFSYLAALAGVDSVVKSRGLVSTDSAQDVIVVVEF